MKQITPVLAVTGLALGLGTVLISVELFLQELPIAAVGVLLLGFAAAMQAWKQQATITILHGVRRRIAQLFTSGSTAARPAPPTTPPAPPAAPTPALAPAPASRPEPDTASKLRQIGTWTPPKTSYSATHGRNAASVTSDPDAPFRLFAATSGFGAPEVSNVTRRAIALVGSDTMAERLSPHFTVQRLHPRLSAAELEHARPTTLIIEEDALSTGPWAGALEPHGSALLMELRVAQAWMRRNAGINYVLPATRAAHIAAPALRADTIVLEEPLPHAQTGNVTLIDTLLQHSSTEQNQ